MQTRFVQKSFAAFMNSRLESAPRILQFPNANCEFPELILRFDSRAHSDDNYAYVTPVEG
jgi:hypothetical protein